MSYVTRQDYEAVSLNIGRQNSLFLLVDDNIEYLENPTQTYNVTIKFNKIIGQGGWR